MQIIQVSIFVYKGCIFPFVMIQLLELLLIFIIIILIISFVSYY